MMRQSSKMSVLLCLAVVLIFCVSIVVVAQNPPQEALVLAVRSDDPVGIETSLKDGAEIDLPGAGGQTPLVTAVLSGKLNAVKVLLEHQADVTIPEKDGYTVAHAAAFQGRAEILRLLATNPQVNLLQQHPDGFYPIHRACWGREPRHAETVQAFLDLGVPHDLASESGKTCLEMLKSELTAQYLMEAQAKAEAEAEL